MQTNGLNAASGSTRLASYSDTCVQQSCISKTEAAHGTAPAVTPHAFPPVDVLEDECVDVANFRHELHTHWQVLQDQQMQTQFTFSSWPYAVRHHFKPYFRHTAVLSRHNTQHPTLLLLLLLRSRNIIHTQ
jgi:hypothetical protein